MAGHYIRTGKDCEPVLLSITYPLKDGKSIDVQRAFPKDSTLNELKVQNSLSSFFILSKYIQFQSVVPDIQRGLVEDILKSLKQRMCGYSLYV